MHLHQCSWSKLILLWNATTSPLSFGAHELQQDLQLYQCSAPNLCGFVTNKLDKLKRHIGKCRALLHAEPCQHFHKWSRWPYSQHKQPNIPVQPSTVALQPGASQGHPSEQVQQQHDQRPPFQQLHPPVNPITGAPCAGKNFRICFLISPSQDSIKT
jgi:hypothetical protein